MLQKMVLQLLSDWITREIQQQGREDIGSAVKTGSGTNSLMTVRPRLHQCVHTTLMTYRISSNSSRASNKRRASNTGRGSEPFVPIDAGGFYSRKYGISYGPTD